MSRRQVTGQADVVKPLGTNHIKIVSMPGFDLEIIEPHDGTDVTAQGGLFPHIAIEVNDIDAAIADLKAAGITNFRGGVDKAAVKHGKSSTDRKASDLCHRQCADSIDRII